MHIVYVIQENCKIIFLQLDKHINIANTSRKLLPQAIINSINYKYFKIHNCIT